MRKSATTGSQSCPSSVQCKKKTEHFFFAFFCFIFEFIFPSCVPATTSHCISPNYVNFLNHFFAQPKTKDIPLKVCFIKVKYSDFGINETLKCSFNFSTKIHQSISKIIRKVWYRWTTFHPVLLMKWKYSRRRKALDTLNSICFVHGKKNFLCLLVLAQLLFVNKF